MNTNEIEKFVKDNGISTRRPNGEWFHFGEVCRLMKLLTNHNPTNSINIPKNLKEKLTKIATDLAEQDTMGTKMPHMFRVMSSKREYRLDDEGDYRSMLYDREAYDFETKEDLLKLTKDFVEGHDISFVKPLEDTTRDWDVDDFIEFLTDRGWTTATYDIGYEFKNSFFTKKACEDHISKNKHHYLDPKPYLVSIFRNPEMETVQEFLCTLVGKKMHK